MNAVLLETASAGVPYTAIRRWAGYEIQMTGMPNKDEKPVTLQDFKNKLFDSIAYPSVGQPLRLKPPRALSCLGLFRI